MTVRFACEKDIPQMNSLLYQVERVHQQGSIATAGMLGAGAK